jgi:hypothetical protein
MIRKQYNIILSACLCLLILSASFAGMYNAFGVNNKLQQDSIKVAEAAVLGEIIDPTLKTKSDSTIDQVPRKTIQRQTVVIPELPKSKNISGEYTNVLYPHLSIKYSSDWKVSTLEPKSKNDLVTFTSPRAKEYLDNSTCASCSVIQFTKDSTLVEYFLETVDSYASIGLYCTQEDKVHKISEDWYRVEINNQNLIYNRASIAFDYDTSQLDDVVSFQQDSVDSTNGWVIPDKNAKTTFKQCVATGLDIFGVSSVADAVSRNSKIAVGTISVFNEQGNESFVRDLIVGTKLDN